MMLRAKNQVAILAAISSFLKRKKVNNLSVSNFYTWCIWLWPALKHCSVYIYVCVCLQLFFCYYESHDDCHALL